MSWSFLTKFLSTNLRLVASWGLVGFFKLVILKLLTSKSALTTAGAAPTGLVIKSSTYFFVAASYGLLGFARFVIRLSDIVRSFVGSEEPSSLRHFGNSIILFCEISILTVLKFTASSLFIRFPRFNILWLLKLTSPLNWETADSQCFDQTCQWLDLFAKNCCSHIHVKLHPHL